MVDTETSPVFPTMVLFAVVLPLPRQKNGGGANFPMKLHEILSRDDVSDIIAWASHGRSWRVLKPKAFEEKIIPQYFRHGKYNSFTRQVNGWGFRRITQGPDHNSYYHEFFLRGLPHLCKKMRRLTATGLARPEACSRVEPDFYRISKISPLPDETSNKNSGKLADNIPKKVENESQPSSPTPVPTAVVKSEKSPVTVFASDNNSTSSLPNSIIGNDDPLNGKLTNPPVEQHAPSLGARNLDPSSYFSSLQQLLQAQAQLQNNNNTPSLLNQQNLIYGDGTNMLAAAAAFQNPEGVNLNNNIQQQLLSLSYMQQGLGQAGMQGFGQAGMQGLGGMQGMQGLGQAGMQGMQGLGQAGMQGLGQAGMQSLGQAGMQGLGQAGIQGLSQACPSIAAIQNASPPHAGTYAGFLGTQMGTQAENPYAGLFGASSDGKNFNIH